VREYPDGTLAVFHGPRRIARYDAEGAEVQVHQGTAIDTENAVPSLSLSEAARLREIKARAKQSLTSEAAIHIFDGNNIAPGGNDMCSRSLIVRLEAERADPENRKFRHPDIMRWTDDHRGEILKAFYTILLGNPTLDEALDAPMQTRFKMWWRLVGSAIEHAAKLAGKQVEFAALFREVEEQDEDEASVVEVLSVLHEWYRREWFRAEDVCKRIEQGNAVLRVFFCPQLRIDAEPSAVSIGIKLKNHVGEPVLKDGKTLILRASKGRAGLTVYRVEVKSGSFL
jgi:hypothetical protein